MDTARKRGGGGWKVKSQPILAETLLLPLKWGQGGTLGQNKLPCKGYSIYISGRAKLPFLSMFNESGGQQGNEGNILNLLNTPLEVFAHN